MFIDQQLEDEKAVSNRKYQKNEGNRCKRSVLMLCLSLAAQIEWGNAGEKNICNSQKTL